MQAAMPDQHDRETIPEHVRRFLLGVQSVPHLEAILLMREDPARQWDTLRVAKRLYMKEEAAAAILADLQAAGIIAQAGEDIYFYRPASVELTDTLNDLAACHAKNLRLVTHLIHSRTGSLAQRLAEAFGLRKEG